MKPYILGIALFAFFFVASMAVNTPPACELLTSPPGYAVNFRIEVWQDNVLTRVCECWSYKQTVDGLRPFAERGLELAPILIEYGQAIEISGTKQEDGK